jgi:quinoprotein glucose dehydrogenase
VSTGEPPAEEHYATVHPEFMGADGGGSSQLGLVYAPTGNTSGSDYCGVRRRAFDEHYSSSVVALDARTGEPRWSFQTVHHDLWDYDVAPQPVLVDLQLGGARLPALLQATKTGEIFVLDRRDGQPLKPVGEMPVSTRSVVPGERVSATPTRVGRDAGICRTDADGSADVGAHPFDQLACRIAFRRARYEGAYTPRHAVLPRVSGDIGRHRVEFCLGGSNARTLVRGCEPHGEFGAVDPA